MEHTLETERYTDRFDYALGERLIHGWTVNRRSMVEWDVEHEEGARLLVDYCEADRTWYITEALYPVYTKGANAALDWIEDRMDGIHRECADRNRVEVSYR